MLSLEANNHELKQSSSKVVQIEEVTVIKDISFMKLEQKDLQRTNMTSNKSGMRGAM